MRSTKDLSHASKSFDTCLGRFIHMSRFGIVLEGRALYRCYRQLSLTGAWSSRLPRDKTFLISQDQMKKCSHLQSLTPSDIAMSTTIVLSVYSPGKIAHQNLRDCCLGSSHLRALNEAEYFHPEHSERPGMKAAYRKGKCCVAWGCTCTNVEKIELARDGR